MREEKGEDIKVIGLGRELCNEHRSIRPRRVLQARLSQESLACETRPSMNRGTERESEKLKEERGGGMNRKRPVTNNY